jgi:magnesium-transporting ATPase (P-type)
MCRTICLSHFRLQVPADGVLISGHSLAIDESSMTGESKVVSLSTTEPFAVPNSAFIGFSLLGDILGPQGSKGTILDVWLQGCRWLWFYVGESRNLKHFDNI